MLKAELIKQLEETTPSPEQPPKRTTVHVLYGGANRFTSDTFIKLSRIARQSFSSCVHNEQDFLELTNKKWSLDLCKDILLAVQNKLDTNPIEDFRIDFEDGYGLHTDLEETQHAGKAGSALTEAMQKDFRPKRIGIRIKPLSTSARTRALQTLREFVDGFVESSGTKLISEFIVVLPKVESANEIKLLCLELQDLEKQHCLPRHFFKIESLVETPQLILGPNGVCPLPSLAEAAEGRLVGFELGAFDLTSSLGVSSAQSVAHPWCQMTRFLMAATAAQYGQYVTDGVINVLPTPNLSADTDEARAANRKLCANAWQEGLTQVERAYREGFLRGWDIHPAQLAVRYTALFGLILQELPDALSRLSNYFSESEKASRVGSTFDDAASIRGLARLVSCALDLGCIKDLPQPLTAERISRAC
jgi:citrate lyase beta subunit